MLGEFADAVVLFKAGEVPDDGFDRRKAANSFYVRNCTDKSACCYKDLKEPDADSSLPRHVSNCTYT